MVLRPGLIVALCFLVYGCFGDTEAVRCETLKQSIDVLQPTTAPISVDSEEIQQRLSTLGYTESENAGYTRLLLDDPSFSWDSRTTSNKTTDTLVQDLANGIDVEPPKTETLWDWWVYLAVNKSDVDDLDCSLGLTDIEKQRLVFFSAHGGEIWSKDAVVDRLIVEHELRFAVIVSRRGVGVFSGLLIQVVEDDLQYTEAQFTSADDLTAILVGTALANLIDKA